MKSREQQAIESCKLSDRCKTMDEDMDRPRNHPGALRPRPEQTIFTVVLLLLDVLGLGVGIVAGRCDTQSRYTALNDKNVEQVDEIVFQRTREISSGRMKTMRTEKNQAMKTATVVIGCCRR